MTAHSKNARIASVIRLALGTAAAGLAVLATAADPAHAINQDQGGGAGVVSSSNDDGGLDVTSAALGALGGIALGGAGLGVTLGVQRRRDHAAARLA